MRCVPAHGFTVAKARAWRSSIDTDPPYQRRGDLWTLGQRQRLIDSLLNGYDVPKFYLHDRRGIEPATVYAVVDGKQRLCAIWSFLDDGFPLAPDFRLESELPSTVDGVERPLPGMRCSDLDTAWRTALLDTYLSVVLIQDADVRQIDELFARLNDGVPFDASQRSSRRAS